MSLIEEYLQENDFITSDKEIEQFNVFDEKIQKIIIADIESHFKNTCECDLSSGLYGLCYAGQWIEGCIDTKDYVENLSCIFEV